MKQTNLFALNTDSTDGKYTNTIKTPVYEPKNKKPHILELYDQTKTKRLINEINLSEIPDDIKGFLVNAAYRHLVFNYEKIADYYSHSTKDIQLLMEKSALVIIDFDRAIEYGYVSLCKDIKNKYTEEHGE